MERDLYSLAYFSRNTIAAEGGALAAEIAQILATARRNNSHLGITGALMLSEGCFAQVLEGRLATIEATFEQIRWDQRHEDLTLLHFQPIDHRSFAGWSMAFSGLNLPAYGPLDMAGMSRNPARIESGKAGRELVALLQELIGHYDEVVGLIPPHHARPSIKVV